MREGLLGDLRIHPHGVEIVPRRQAHEHERHEAHGDEQKDGNDETFNDESEHNFSVNSGYFSTLTEIQDVRRIIYSFISQPKVVKKTFLLITTLIISSYIKISGRTLKFEMP